MAGCVQIYYQPSYALFELFDRNEEILSFNNVEELSVIIETLINDLPKAERIARNAQARAVRDHSYRTRAQTILQHVGLGADLER
ncbi:MAG: glycosyltransferase [Sphingobium sp.]|nr:glycosyltransferase [Sphingobium sp.]